MPPFLVAVVLLLGHVLPGHANPLPNPLTLGAALVLADAAHPVLELSVAELDAANADLLTEDARIGARISLDSRLRAIEPARLSPNQDRNDSSIDLRVRKQLMDFGYVQARQDAASQRVDGRQWQFLTARQEQHLEIMSRYFEALNADMTYLWRDEATSLAGFLSRQARDENELGRLSDVELLQLESRYQAARQARSQTESRQRASRAQLAIALNRPGDLPDDLQMPDDPDYQTQLPEIELIQQQVLVNNPQLKMLEAQREAAAQALRAADLSYGPVLHGEIDAGVYSRESGFTHPLAAGLLLEIPFASGGRKDAERAGARAGLRRAQARLDQARLQVQQEALDLWLELNDLGIQLEALRSRADYRELSLDRARARFELEIDADIGDAMVQISSLLRDRAETVLQWLMTEARLKALQGKLLGPAEVENGVNGEG